jgi:hypothetical protein
MSRSSAVALAVVLAVACVPPGTDTTPDDDATAELVAPTFSPVPTAPVPTTPASASDPGPAPTSVTPGPTTSATPSPPQPLHLTGTIEDGTNDLDGEGASDAPDWADLRRATLLREDEQVTITIEFAQPAPEFGRDNEIVNIATYHDITGDGHVDFEIWASLTADGWGTSYWDNQDGTVQYAAEDDVDIAVEGGDLVLTFPPGHLDNATVGRWQVSLEYVGQTLVFQRLAGDEAPDDRNGAWWPSA